MTLDLSSEKKSPLTQVIWEDQSGRKQRPEQVVDMIELSNDPFVGAFLVNDKNFDRQARAKSLLSCNLFA